MRRTRSSHKRRPRPGVLILCAALLALLVKGFVIDLAIVEGLSMLPAYDPGDVVVVLRCAYGLRLPFGIADSRAYLLRWATPKAGEVVAAQSPNDGTAVVKRVAARGPLQLRIEGGHLRGGNLDLELLPDELAILGLGFDLPPDSVFLLGDNLAESLDSRSYGPVSVDALAGRILGGPLFGQGKAGRRKLASMAREAQDSPGTNKMTKGGSS